MKFEDQEISLCVEYARVSTEHESQAESCSNQIMLCDEYVERHPELRVVKRYIDDGLTGATNKRPQFESMIKRIREGDIRYIIAKNEDRLCRSTEVDGYLQTVCRENDVMIIFIESGAVFNPFDGEHVTMHGFKAVMNQQYVFHQSKVGKIAHEQKCKAKRLNATDVRFGYYWDYENKCMAINEEEAVWVRQMFEWYVFGGLGVTEIARKLAERGVYGEYSGKILTANTVTSRLSDESYKGVFHINKKGSVLSVGMNAKKKRFTRPKDEWVAVEGPAIVSEELFDLAQRLREERKRVYDVSDGTPAQGRFKGTHLFSGKVFCGDCGTQFHFRYSDRAKTIGEYKDYFGKSKKKLSDECHNKLYNRIREDTLIAICQYSINVFLKNHEACIDSIVDIIREASIAAMNDDEPLRMYQKQLDKVERELKKNLLAWREAPDQSMKDAFYEMYLGNKTHKEDLERKICEIQNRQQDMSDLEGSILEIKKKIEDMKQIKVIDRQVVENFIDRIIIHKDGTINVTLKFNSSLNALIKPVVYTDYGSSPYFPVDNVTISNLKFINNKEEIGKYILYMQLGRCSDRTRWVDIDRTCQQCKRHAYPVRNHGFDGC